MTGPARTRDEIHAREAPQLASIDAPERAAQPSAPVSAAMRRALANPRSLSRADAVALQRTIGNAAVAQLAAQAAPKENRTGLPEQLKAGVEGLSSVALDDVRVHYNSALPARVQAHAYAQAPDIHIAPGQEKYLPHEAWHVVQQKQGRVKPTLQMKGVAINDDDALEREADAMGATARQFDGRQSDAHLARRGDPGAGAAVPGSIAQRKIGSGGLPLAVKRRKVRAIQTNKIGTITKATVRSGAGMIYSVKFDDQKQEEEIRADDDNYELYDEAAAAFAAETKLIVDHIRASVDKQHRTKKKKPSSEFDPDLMASMVALRDETPDSLELRRQAEASARMMLLYGENWIDKAQNLRATRGAEDKSNNVQITDRPSMTLEKMMAAKPEELSVEPLMLAFQRYYADEKTREFAAVHALEEISALNLKKLSSDAYLHYKDDEKSVSKLKELVALNLTLTHYADQNRQFVVQMDRRNVNIINLFSRQLLDESSKKLGVMNYSTSNTPSSAKKNVGHHDFVFFSVEPRAQAALSAPHKESSRFGPFCHAVDLDAIPDLAIMTLGDLDTKNAKISLTRLEGALGKQLAGKIKANFEQRKIHQGSDEVEITVRTFDRLSEQIFIKKHVKEALVLCVAREVARFQLPLDKIDATMYNTLINSLFVPQVMVPRAFASTKVKVFEG